MKILIIPDSFKGSSTSVEVADCIETGIKRVFPHAKTVKIPVADGGEGTVEALLAGAGGTRHSCTVTGPLGEKRSACFVVLPDGTAVIEMAAASGLALVPHAKRNPLYTTTFGTGQLMRTAMDLGCTKIVIGIGGSATNDGGAGMAQALGVSLTDASGRELPYGADALRKLAHIDISGLDPRIAETEIITACDVNNPLCGENGASAIFGPQKGATKEMVQILDQNLKNLSQKVFEQLGSKMDTVAGAGAAGGLGFGLMVFCGAKLQSGIEMVLDVAHVDDILQTCDLVITGEGRIDGQSIMGKVPVGVAVRAKKYHVPVVAIVGGMGEGANEVYEHGIDAIMCTVNGAMRMEDAMQRTRELLEDAAFRVAKLIQIGQSL